jgi:uncharacterized iron-regulated membrane protein
VKVVVPARLRKIIFWAHLGTASLAGIFIFIMSVTGAALAYQQEITDWGNRAYRSAPPSPGATKLPLETVLSRLRDAEPSATPSQIVVSSDVDAPLSVRLGRQEGSRTVFVNPYTAAIVATAGTNSVDEAMRRIEGVHRFLSPGAREERAGTVGRALTGASTLAFSFIVFSGFFLWWPRSWRLSALRNSVFFRKGARGQARDFNWHNVIGFWALVPLLIISVSGVTMAYPWATNLVYRLSGSPVVSRGGQEGPRGRGRRGNEANARGENDQSAVEVAANSASLDDLLAHAEQQVPQWRFVTMQVPRPSDPDVTFSVDPNVSRSPNKRVTFTMDRMTGRVGAMQTAANGNRGAQIRSWLRSAHTGQVYGVPSQTIAMLVCIGAAFEVWTGLSLLWRQIRQWLTSRVVPSPSPSEVEVLVRSPASAD